MANSSFVASNGSNSCSNSFQVIGRLGEGKVVRRIKEERRGQKVWTEKDILCEGSPMGVDTYFRHFSPGDFDTIYGKNNWRVFRRTSYEGGSKFVQVILEVRR